MADATMPNLFEMLRGLVNDRVYLGVAEKSADPRPFIVWEPVATLPELQLSGRPTIDRYVILVSVYGTDPTSAQQMAFRVRDTLESWAHVTGGPTNRGMESDTRLWRWNIEVIFMWRRNG